MKSNETSSSAMVVETTFPIIASQSILATYRERMLVCLLTCLLTSLVTPAVKRIVLSCTNDTCLKIILILIIANLRARRNIKNFRN